MASVLRSACTMLNSPTEFASRDAALAYLKEARGTRETEASLNHRIDRVGTGYRVKHDPVRVGQGLTHMAKDLRAYAARASTSRAATCCTSRTRRVPRGQSIRSSRASAALA